MKAHLDEDDHDKMIKRWSGMAHANKTFNSGMMTNNVEKT
jgi:hypothetical protein